MVTCVIPFLNHNIIRKIFLLHDVDTSLPSSPCHLPTLWVKGLCHPTRGGQALEESNHLEYKEWEEVTSSTDLPSLGIPSPSQSRSTL